MKTRLLFIASLASAAMISLVSAQDAAAGAPAKKPGEAFKKLDTNADGSLSKEEFIAPAKDEAQKTRMVARFTTLDKDGDGKLTQAEMAAGRAAHAKKGKKKAAGGDAPPPPPQE